MFLFEILPLRFRFHDTSPRPLLSTTKVFNARQFLQNSRPKTRVFKAKTSKSRPKTCLFKPKTRESGPKTSKSGPKTIKFRVKTSKYKPKTSKFEPKTRVFGLYYGHNFLAVSGQHKPFQQLTQFSTAVEKFHLIPI